MTALSGGDVAQAAAVLAATEHAAARQQPHASTSSSANVSEHSMRTRRRSTKLQLGDTGPRKPTPAAKAEGLFNQLLGLLNTEWKSIRSLNLGVRSGTGVVEELIMRKIQHYAADLHTLVVLQDSAAARVSQLARALSKDELQQLQIMLDVTGHECLTDFIRTMVYNTSNPLAREPLLTNVRLRSPRQPRPRKADSAARATLTDTALEDLPSSVRRPDRDELIRFTGFMEPDSYLARKAYDLYYSRLPPSPKTRASSGASASQGEREPTAEELLRASGLGPLVLKEPKQKRHHPPMWVDVEAVWRDTTHTVTKEEVLNTIMISNPLPAYVVPPAFKNRPPSNPSSPLTGTAQQTPLSNSPSMSSMPSLHGRAMGGGQVSMSPRSTLKPLGSIQRRAPSSLSLATGPNDKPPAGAPVPPGGPVITHISNLSQQQQQHPGSGAMSRVGSRMLADIPSSSTLGVSEASLAG